MCYKFYGIYTVINILKYKYSYVEKLYISNNKLNKKIKIILYLSKLRFIKVEFVSNSSIDKLMKNKYMVNHQGVVIFLKKSVSFSGSENEFFDLLKKKNNLILILDRINDPYNLGSCIRTAVASGVDIIIISKRNTVSLKNNIVHKVSTGTIYKIFILEVVSLLKIIKILHSYNFFVISTTVFDTKYTLFNFDFNSFSLLAIVFGSEEDGVKKIIQKKSDCLIKIPMLNNSNSLNVSVSNGIFLFEVFRQRRKI